MSSSSERTVESITFGRTLVNGEPVDEGLTLPVDSPTLKILKTAFSPLLSNPIRGEYGAGLVSAEETDGKYMRALALTPPGAGGPPPHYHPNYAEHFEVIEGEFVFELDGQNQMLHRGDSITVEPGRVHTFRNESDSYSTCTVEARSAGRLTDTIHLLWGLGHEDGLNSNGQPSFLQAMVMAEEMGDDTIFASPPESIQKFMVALFAPLGRLLGYSAKYPKYDEDSFWEARVEQPDLSLVDSYED